MRHCVLGIAAVIATALPAAAQSQRDVSGPWTLTPTVVLCTDLPVPAKPSPRLTITGLHLPDPRTALAKGTVVIKRTADDGLKIGQRYVASRLHTDPRQFPKPGEGFGNVRVTGIVEIKALDEVNALADVTMACDAIAIGDALEPFTDTTLPRDAAAMDPPDFSDRARVLFGNDNRVAFGFGDVMNIDRGTLHGVAPGARYAIYRDKQNGLPLVYIGEVVVMTTAELTSKVSVTKANDSINEGDVAVPRRKP